MVVCDVAPSACTCYFHSWIVLKLSFVHFPAPSILVSMSPLSQEVQSVSSCSPPHLGPAIAEMNSIWFKLWFYKKLGSGPPSLLLAKGNRLRKLPAVIKV